MKHLFGALICLLASNKAVAQGQIPCEVGIRPTAIFFINGINTSSIQAKSGADLLEAKIVKAMQKDVDLRRVPRDCIVVAAAYSHAHGVLNDIDEVEAFKTDEDLIVHYRSVIAGGDSHAADVIEARQALKAINAYEYTSMEDLHGFVDDIFEPALKNNSATLLVGHSEGNLHANSSYRILEDRGESGGLRLVAIASPARMVEGGGPWTRTIEDDVIGHFLTALPWNTSNTFYLPCFIPIACHLMSSYVNGESSGPMIFGDILRALPRQQVVPTLFYDEGDPSFRFGQPSIDTAGALYVARTQSAPNCAFGFCGGWLQKIVPDGVGWMSGKLGDVLNPAGITIAPGNRAYFQGERNVLYAFESNGSSSPGVWPVEFAPFFNNSFAVNTFVDGASGEVVAQTQTIGACFNQCFDVVRTLRSDGTELWGRQFNERSPLAIGPAGDVYIGSLGQLIHFDRHTGTEVCRERVQNAFGWLGSSDGLFATAENLILRFEPDCRTRLIGAIGGGSRYLLNAYDSKRLFGFEYTGSLAQPYDSMKDRLFGLSTEQILIWRQDRIAPILNLDIRAVRDNVLYVLGLDKLDALRQKLFLVDTSTGGIINTADLTGICQNCGVAVAPDGTTYVNDLTSTRIFKIQ